mgnify:CR=1 FL=1
MSQSPKDDFTNRQYYDLRTAGVQLPYTSEGKSVFYAGGDNWRRAELYADFNKLSPVENTKAGEFISQVDTRQTFGLERNRRIWDEASRQYASQAHGEVRTFVAGANDASTFRRVELPTILRNENITDVNGKDRAEIAELKKAVYERCVDQGRDNKEAMRIANNTAFRSVAMAEIRIDLQNAKENNNARIQADADKRVEAVREQNRIEIAKAQEYKKEQVLKQEAEQKQEAAKQDEVKKNALEKQEQQKQDYAKEQAEQKASEKYSVDRYNMVAHNAENKAIERGMSVEGAVRAGELRVQQVQEKLDLMQERQALKDRGEKLTEQESMAHAQKEQEFREQRQRSLSELAEKEEIAYKGPPEKSTEQRQKETRVEELSFRNDVRLEARYQQGDESTDNYSRLKEQQEQRLQEQRQEIQDKYQEQSSAQSYETQETRSHEVSENMDNVQHDHNSSQDHGMRNGG